MRTYVMTTGAIFALLVVAHVWRMVAERGIADPGYLLITSIAAALSAWAWRLVRTTPKS